MGWVIGGGLAAFATALSGIGVVFWRRTSELRGGADAPAPPAATLEKTGSSPATFLAAAGGLFLAASSAWAARRGGAVFLLPGLAGAFVFLSGLRLRVTALQVSPTGVTVWYPGRRTFFVGWEPGLSVRAPKTPLGGWRIESSSGARTLMPSDLLGREEVLAALMIRARQHGGMEPERAAGTAIPGLERDQRSVRYPVGRPWRPGSVARPDALPAAVRPASSAPGRPQQRREG
jgi:hypothetical protein